MIKRIREAATAVGDPTITEDQAHIEVELADGRRLSKFVEQSLGNIHRPLSDKQLERSSAIRRSWCCRRAMSRR